jgi:hypothetical protein
MICKVDTACDRIDAFHPERPARDDAWARAAQVLVLVLVLVQALAQAQRASAGSTIAILPLAQPRGGQT